jgi:hypothetical protein
MLITLQEIQHVAFHQFNQFDFERPKIHLAGSQQFVRISM